MSDTKKKNQELSLSVKKTAEKLRSLANGLERGRISINEEDIPISLDTKIRISLHSKDKRVSIKLKCKPTDTSVPDNDKPRMKEYTDTHRKKQEMEAQESKPSMGSALEGYSILKKRMAKDFGAIMKSCIKEHSLPESILVERFYQDSKAMCNYPEKGEEFYEIYLKETESLSEAFRKSDLKAISVAIATLNRIKKECHDRYK